VVRLKQKNDREKMIKIEVNKDIQHERRILVSFPYNPEFVSKVKSIDGYS
jgi:hypothetical protein